MLIYAVEWWWVFEYDCWYDTDYDAYSSDDDDDDDDTYDDGTVLIMMIIDVYAIFILFLLYP